MAQVHEKATGKETIETRWYISSLGLNAEQALSAVRSLGKLKVCTECLIWRLEKMNQGYVKKQGPLVFNIMRKIAMALFKKDTTKSASMARKKKMAGLDDDYRSSLLESGIKMR